MVRLGTFTMILACFVGCPSSPPATDDDATDPSDDDTGPANEVVADVQAVSVTGEPGAYTFAATLLTADIDCDQYADWWEVVTPGGELVYRRILQHSHPDEQPFTRDGGPVTVQAEDEVLVRAHMNTTGYGGAAMRGSVSTGFTIDPEIDGEFAAELASQEPLPTDCLY